MVDRMTDDIKLPPLPDPMWPEYVLCAYSDAYSERQMQDYARAAILADRERRGEPVAEVGDLFLHVRERVMAKHGPVNRAGLYLAPPPALPEWIACSERMPDIRRLVLLIAINAGPRGNYTTDHWVGWRDGGGVWARWPHKFPPSHWMPLPAAPTPTPPKFINEAEAENFMALTGWRPTPPADAREAIETALRHLAKAQAEHIADSFPISNSVGLAQAALRAALAGGKA